MTDQTFDVKPRQDFDYDKVLHAVELLISALPSDEGKEDTKGTPRRAAKAWAEMLGGYTVDVEELLATKYEPEPTVPYVDRMQMITLRDIEFSSVCEHHLLPIIGTAHIAYTPGSHGVVGLSKLARLVDAYARRLQVQERMTRQIGGALQTYGGARGVAVIVDAKHGCMSCRGVKQHNSVMTTTYAGGHCLLDPLFSHAFAMLRGR